MGSIPPKMPDNPATKAARGALKAVNKLAGATRSLLAISEDHEDRLQALEVDIEELKDLVREYGTRIYVLEQEHTVIDGPTGERWVGHVCYLGEGNDLDT